MKINDPILKFKVWRREKLLMYQSKINSLLGLVLFLVVALGCKPSSNTNNSNQQGNAPAVAQESGTKNRRLDSYTIKGFKFSYYLIPAGLSRDDLIATAQELHDADPDAQLILVDDDSQVQEYITYAKGLSQGNDEAKPPTEWADKHIVANLQKLMSGKFMLCESNGSVEIAILK
jgi:hypothetical protein